MKQLLAAILVYLDNRKDYEMEFNDINPRYRGNEEANLYEKIQFLEGIDEEEMWHEILEYCEDKGLTEWAQQIENYFVNTSIG